MKVSKLLALLFLHIHKVDKLLYEDESTVFNCGLNKSFSLYLISNNIHLTIFTVLYMFHRNYMRKQAR